MYTPCFDHAKARFRKRWYSLFYCRSASELAAIVGPVEPLGEKITAADGDALVDRNGVGVHGRYAKGKGAGAAGADVRATGLTLTEENGAGPSAAVKTMDGVESEQEGGRAWAMTSARVMERVARSWAKRVGHSSG